MFQKWKDYHHTLTARFLTFALIISFSLSCIAPQAVYAQNILLPTPGTLLSPSGPYTPALMLGMTINPEDPFQLDFIIDRGTSGLYDSALETETQKLLQYFYAAMTVPEEDMWVNLSPYEQDRIIANGLGDTVLGRDMLAQDYVLKQLSASIAYPETEFGQKFWSRVRAQVEETYGDARIPMNTFNKIWILPETASVYTHKHSVFVVDNHLKVMLEEDYLALEHNSQSVSSGDTVTGVTNNIVREILIPEIEHEINHGQHFAPLRQMFHAMILATWYKQNLKTSLLTLTLANQNKTQGIDTQDKEAIQKIYDQYTQAFEAGVYNYIKEETDPKTGETIPRKYFSGGINGDLAMTEAMPGSTFLKRGDNAMKVSTKAVLGSEQTTTPPEEFPQIYTLDGEKQTTTLPKSIFNRPGWVNTITFTDVDGNSVVLQIVPRDTFIQMLPLSDGINITTHQNEFRVTPSISTNTSNPLYIALTPFDSDGHFQRGDDQILFEIPEKTTLRIEFKLLDNSEQDNFAPTDRVLYPRLNPPGAYQGSAQDITSYGLMSPLWKRFVHLAERLTVLQQSGFQKILNEQIEADLNAITPNEKTLIRLMLESLARELPDDIRLETYDDVLDGIYSVTILSFPSGTDSFVSKVEKYFNNNQLPIPSPNGDRAMNDAAAGLDATTILLQRKADPSGTRGRTDQGMRTNNPEGQSEPSVTAHDWTIETTRYQIQVSRQGENDLVQITMSAISDDNVTPPSQADWVGMIPAKNAEEIIKQLNKLSASQDASNIPELFLSLSSHLRNAGDPAPEMGAFSLTPRITLSSYRGETTVNVQPRGSTIFYALAQIFLSQSDDQREPFTHKIILGLQSNASHKSLLIKLNRTFLLDLLPKKTRGTRAPNEYQFRPWIEEALTQDPEAFQRVLEEDSEFFSILDKTYSTFPLKTEMANALMRLIRTLFQNRLITEDTAQDTLNDMLADLRLIFHSSVPVVSDPLTTRLYRVENMESHLSAVEEMIDDPLAEKWQALGAAYQAFKAQHLEEKPTLDDILTSTQDVVAAYSRLKATAEEQGQSLDLSAFESFFDNLTARLERIDQLSDLKFIPEEGTPFLNTRSGDRAMTGQPFSLPRTEEGLQALIQLIDSLKSAHKDLEDTNLNMFRFLTFTQKINLGTKDLTIPQLIQLESLLASFLNVFGLLGEDGTTFYPFFHSGGRIDQEVSAMKHRLAFLKAISKKLIQDPQYKPQEEFPIWLANLQRLLPKINLLTSTEEKVPLSLNQRFAFLRDIKDALEVFESDGSEFSRLYNILDQLISRYSTALSEQTSSELSPTQKNTINTMLNQTNPENLETLAHLAFVLDVLTPSQERTPDPFPSATELLTQDVTQGTRGGDAAMIEWTHSERLALSRVVLSGITTWGSGFTYIGLGTQKSPFRINSEEIYFSEIVRKFLGKVFRELNMPGRIEYVPHPVANGYDKVKGFKVYFDEQYYRILDAYLREEAAIQPFTLDEEHSSFSIPLTEVMGADRDNFISIVIDGTEYIIRLVPEDGEASFRLQSLHKNLKINTDQNTFQISTNNDQNILVLTLTDPESARPTIEFQFSNPVRKHLSANAVVTVFTGSQQAIKASTRFEGLVQEEYPLQKGAAEDAAMNGGIDFNAGNLNLQAPDEPIQFSVDPGMLNFDPVAVNGVVPVILNMTPVTNFPLLLGMQREKYFREEELQLTSSAS